MYIFDGAPSAVAPHWLYVFTGRSGGGVARPVTPVGSRLSPPPPPRRVRTRRDDARQLLRIARRTGQMQSVRQDIAGTPFPLMVTIVTIGINLQSFSFVQLFLTHCLRLIHALWSLSQICQDHSRHNFPSFVSSFRSFHRGLWKENAQRSIQFMPGVAGHDLSVSGPLDYCIYDRLYGANGKKYAAISDYWTREDAHISPDVTVLSHMHDLRADYGFCFLRPGVSPRKGCRGDVAASACVHRSNCSTTTCYRQQHWCLPR